MFRSEQSDYWRNRTLCDEILKPRKRGFSALISAEFLTACILEENTNAVVVAHRDEDAKELFKRVRWMVKTLPFPVDVSEEGAGHLSFGALNSQFRVITAGATQPGRGRDITHLHLSERAFYPNEDFLAAVEGACIQGARRVIETTANGAGTPFHKHWLKSKRGETAYKTHFFPWWAAADYEIETAALVHDEAEKRLVEAYGLSDRKLAWRRQKMREMSNPDLFDQEYPHCVSGDTLICTDMGIVPIRDASRALTADGNAVSKFMPQGRKPVFSVKTGYGREIVATADHKIGLSDGTFLEVQHLNVGDEIKLIPATFAAHINVVCWSPMPGMVSSIKINEDWGRFLGYFMGDGSFYGGTLSFCCDAKDGDIIGDISGLVKKLFGLDVSTRTVGSKGGGVEIRVRSSRLQEIFGALGIIKPKFRDDGSVMYWNRKVCVPRCILRSPQAVVRQFLSALFECDGCSYHYQPRVMFFSKYLDFMREVALLLSGFGVNGKVSSVKKKSSLVKEYMGNEIALTARNSLAFHDNIGFLSERKKAGYRYKSKTVGRVAIAVKTSDAVVSITAAGETDVFDISVPATRSFSANGLLVHNCDETAFLVSGRMVFDWVAIQRQAQAVAAVKWQGRLANMGHKIELVPGENGPLRVWATPMESRRYVLSADIAEGLSDGAWSVCDVLDVSTWEQVAQWRGHCTPTEFADVIGDLGAYYNWGTVAPEVNNHGLATCARLADQGYPNLYVRAEKSEGVDYGWLTTLKSKTLMINSLSHALKSMDVKINSEDTLDEMKSFVYLETRDKMAATAGAFSDCVMSLAIGVALLGDMKETPMTQRQRFREALGLRYKVPNMQRKESGYGRRMA